MRVETHTGEAAVRLAESCAAIYAAAFGPSGARVWSEEEFKALARKDTTVFFVAPYSFLVLEIIGDEAEILTVAVMRDKQGQGLGRALLDEMASLCACRKVKRCILEVASDNHAAIFLYHSIEFAQIAVRNGYFRRDSGPVDALVMERLFADP